MILELIVIFLAYVAPLMEEVLFIMFSAFLWHVTPACYQSSSVHSLLCLPLLLTHWCPDSNTTICDLILFETFSCYVLLRVFGPSDIWLMAQHMKIFKCTYANIVNIQNGFLQSNYLFKCCESPSLCFPS